MQTSELPHLRGKGAVLFIHHPSLATDCGLLRQELTLSYFFPNPWAKENSVTREIPQMKEHRAWRKEAGLVRTEVEGNRGVDEAPGASTIAHLFRMKRQMLSK